MESCGRFHIPALFSRDFFTAGFTLMPNLVLRYSARLHLASTDILVLLACFYYQQQGRNDIECRSLAKLLNLPEKIVHNSIDAMAASGLIVYNNDDTYNFAGLFEKIADLWAEEKVQAMQNARKEAATAAAGSATAENAPDGNASSDARQARAELAGATPAAKMWSQHLHDLLQTFEREFGRTLSQIEIATITGWQRDKGHSDALILEALKKAVLRGVLNLTYIDRILSHWSKKNLRTVQEVDRYEEQYIAAKQPKKEKAKVKTEENNDKYKDFFVV